MNQENFIHAITIGQCIVYISLYELLKQSKENGAFGEWWGMFAIDSYYGMLGKYCFYFDYEK